MINLLPPEEKANLSREENRRLLIILGFLFLVFSLSLFLILIAIKIYIYGTVQAQKVINEIEKERTETVQAQDLFKKVSDTNIVLTKLDSFYYQQIHLTKAIEKINRLLPSGTYLNSFYYLEKTSKIVLVGFSPSREELLEFKDNLEQEKAFQKIDFPPGLLAKSSNIDFNISFKIIFTGDE